MTANEKAIEALRNDVSELKQFRDDFDSKVDTKLDPRVNDLKAQVEAQQLEIEALRGELQQARDALQQAISRVQDTANNAQNAANRAVQGKLTGLAVVGSNHAQIRAHDLWFGGVRNPDLKRALVEQEDVLHIGWSTDWPQVKVNSDLTVARLISSGDGYASPNGQWILRVKNSGQLALIRRSDGKEVWHT